MAFPQPHEPAQWTHGAPNPAAAPEVRLDGSGDDAASGIKCVPPSAEARERIRLEAACAARGIDRSRPPARHEMERLARDMLGRLDLPERYLGWTMVAVGSEFWKDQVAAVPHARRLLLLPQCLRDAERCPARFNALGLLCQDCGLCELTRLRGEAERRGYKVLLAEGSPAVMQIILGGHADALLGVACLDVLERTLDKILLAGIPSMAVPLLGNGCRNTTAELEAVRRMIETPYHPAAIQTHSYLHLMRCAARLFEPEELGRLAPRRRAAAIDPDDPLGAIERLDAIECTEAVAYDFLAAGGKHSRPFLTLACYDAIRGGECTLADGAERAARLPQAVRAVALAIEVFHKASLVHDDVEDDDASRYGRPALHRAYGPATAINVGDFLIGLGYRLVAEQSPSLGAEAAADILGIFAHAHTRLCEGQGAELIWRDARRRRLAPMDASRIYALKTAPAFEAAIAAGIRLAGPIEPYRQAAATFSRHLGVAYQMVNDLDDWQSSPENRRTRGTDILGGRPTMLWALAMENLDAADGRRLEALLDPPGDPAARIEAARELYLRAGVFAQVAELIRRHHRRARETADRLPEEPLRRLWHFVADAILDRRPLAIAETRLAAASTRPEPSDEPRGRGR